MNLKSKSDERCCLNIVKELKPYPELTGTILEQERPDFIIRNNDIGCTGIEHFLIDVITDPIIIEKKNKVSQKNDSIVRKTTTEIEKQVNNYKNKDNLEEDISNGKAATFVEDIINRTLKGVGQFSYEDFIKNFMRIYNKHYKNVSTYREKCQTLGFLIEIRYFNPSHNGYLISNKNKTYLQRTKTIPVTRDMITCFHESKNIDFIILCMVPINYSENLKDCQVIRIDMDNIENSLRQQHIIICDKFDYYKFQNLNTIKITQTNS